MRMGSNGIKHALSDVDRALKAGHPSPAKLLERKITCIQELGIFSEVRYQNCGRIYGCISEQPS